MSKKVNALVTSFIDTRLELFSAKFATEINLKNKRIITFLSAKKGPFKYKIRLLMCSLWPRQKVITITDQFYLLIFCEWDHEM